jgi:hypothetical protein
MSLAKASRVAILLIAPTFAGDETQPALRDLTVHEWGTFTSVAGDDGFAMDWDALGCKSDLPKFVNDFGYRDFKWRLHGTVRMETPVLYFYSERALEAHVKVAFPQGLITEWYPQAHYQVFQKDKNGGPMKPLAANLNEIDTSLKTLAGAIEWKNIQVQPDSSPVLPIESDPSRYYAARETDSVPITVGDQHEKFLFYRGVGRFPVPLYARLSSDGKLMLENHGAVPISSMILFANRAGRIGFRKVGAVEGAVAVELPSLDGSLPQLLYDLEATLIAQGLFPKEAHAMVDTWRDSWFEEGSRLIYILPARSVDESLPLQIEPTPSAIARVFVGRIELITPDTMHLVEEAIAKGDWLAVDRYSRFLSPILSRIYAGNPTKAAQVEQLFRDAQNSSGGSSCR